MTQKTHWLSILPKTIGLCAGIILTAVGSVMLLNAVLKLYVIQFDTPRYTDDYRMSCEYAPVNHYTEKPKEPALRTEAELEKCMTEKKQNAKNQYQRNKKEDMVSGMSSLIVGIFFWIWFGRRKKQAS
jgi:hypothetical protein